MSDYWDNVSDHDTVCPMCGEMVPPDSRHYQTKCVDALRSERDRLKAEVLHLRTVARCNITLCQEPIVHAFCLKHLHKEREAAKRMIQERDEAANKLDSLRRVMLGESGGE